MKRNTKNISANRSYEQEHKTRSAEQTRYMISDTNNTRRDDKSVSRPDMESLNKTDNGQTEMNRKKKIKYRLNKSMDA